MANNYDVFISFKCRDAKGAFTQDREIAAMIAEKLTNDYHLKTFFSETEIMKSGNSDFAEEILSALEKTTILLVLATDNAYLDKDGDGKWLHFEYSSFVTLNNNPGKFGERLSYVSKNVTKIPNILGIREVFRIEETSVDEVCKFVRYAYDRQTALKNEYETNNALKQEKEAIKAQIQVFEETKNRPETTKNGIAVSTYNPAEGVEKLRLKLQALNTRDADMPALEYVRMHTPFEHYNIIDFGCAYGYVTKDRFDSFPYCKVIGVDFSESCINFANENNDDPRFHFERLDLEGDEFVENLEAIMAKYDIKSFDIMFSSLVIHHLKDPRSFLRRIKKYLSKDGYIVLRGSDDGSMIAYGDDGLVKQIVDKTMEVEGISDRLNGRKLYSQLVKTGYHEVQMKSFIKDLTLVDFEDRNSIFRERFAYRIDYANKDVARHPDDPVKIKRQKDLKRMLNDLENMFEDPEFWYCETDFVAIAKR